MGTAPDLTWPESTRHSVTLFLLVADEAQASHFPPPPPPNVPVAPLKCTTGSQREPVTRHRSRHARSTRSRAETHVPGSLEVVSAARRGEAARERDDAVAENPESQATVSHSLLFSFLQNARERQLHTVIAFVPMRGVGIFSIVADK